MRRATGSTGSGSDLVRKTELGEDVTEPYNQEHELWTPVWIHVTYGTHIGNIRRQGLLCGGRAGKKKRSTVMWTTSTTHYRGGATHITVWDGEAILAAGNKVGINDQGVISSPAITIDDPAFPGIPARFLLGVQEIASGKTVYSVLDDEDRDLCDHLGECAWTGLIGNNDAEEIKRLLPQGSVDDYRATLKCFWNIWLPLA